MEPILSHWITIDDSRGVLLPMFRGPCAASAAGCGSAGQAGARRRGVPVGRRAGADGDQDRSDGRFCAGRIFAKGRCFSLCAARDFGSSARLIKPGEGDIAVDLTAPASGRAREMRMLADPIPLEESRALARRLLEPYLEGFENKERQLTRFSSCGRSRRPILTVSCEAGGAEVGTRRSR